MFAKKNMYVDLGYLGIGKDYTIGTLNIPHKKPRKSKKNPKPSLTDQQKTENQAIGRIRVCVENSIAGMKRYNILTVKYRGKSIKDFDESIELCAGLWNYKVDKRTCNNTK
jgi:hypothetical protein